MGLVRSATGKVGCFPLMRKSSFVTVGWAGSSLRGPAPFAGGLNPALTASQLTLALEEKLGGDAVGAASAAPAQRTPAKTPTQPDIRFAADLDISIFSLCRKRIGISRRFYFVS